MELEIANVLLQVAFESVLKMAVHAAPQAVQRRRNSTSQRSIAWADITKYASDSQGLELALLAQEPNDAIGGALSRFLKAPEGEILSRYIAIAE